MRNMSFMLTKQQVIDQTKDVTRRLGWDNLKKDEHVRAVEKAMGLKNGEKIIEITTIVIVTRWREPLNFITPHEVVREGFPGMSPEWFIDFFCSSHKKCFPDTPVNRIQFSYLYPKI